MASAAQSREARSKNGDIRVKGSPGRPIRPGLVRRVVPLGGSAVRWLPKIADPSTNPAGSLALIWNRLLPKPPDARPSRVRLQDYINVETPVATAIPEIGRTCHSRGFTVTQRALLLTFTNSANDGRQSHFTFSQLSPSQEIRVRVDSRVNCYPRPRMRPSLRPSWSNESALRRVGRRIRRGGSSCTRPSGLAIRTAIRKQLSQFLVRPN